MGTVREQTYKLIADLEHAIAYAGSVEFSRVASQALRFLQDNAATIAAAEETAAERDRLAASNAVLREACEAARRRIIELAEYCGLDSVGTLDTLTQALSLTHAEHHSRLAERVKTLEELLRRSMVHFHHTNTALATEIALSLAAQPKEGGK